MKRQKEDKLFSNEGKILDRYREILEKEKKDKVDRSFLLELTNKYSNLLDQSKFITWVSGRLERKLQKANRELFEQNHQMQKTVDELRKARAGRSAYAVIYFIAIVLFVLEELFIEPLITMVGGGVWYDILIKLVIVLLLKSSEGFIEERMLIMSRLKAVRKNKVGVA